MTDLQKELLTLLCEIDEICTKHNIEYALFGGSSLGAQRHHGFIPWDDDADIIMSLENYEKFIAAAPKELKNNRMLDCLEDGDHGYMFTYARYVNTETTAIQRHTAFGGCHPGIKVDIFYAVPTFDNPDMAYMHKQRILAFGEAIMPYGVMFQYRDDEFFPLYREAREQLESKGRKRYVEETLDSLKHVGIEKPENYVLFSGMMTNSFVIPARFFDNIEKCPFENTRLSISSYDMDVVYTIFGESWMRIPPDFDKPRHTMLIDTASTYTEYIKKMAQDEQFMADRELAENRRNVHLVEREQYDTVLNNRQKISNLVTAMKIEAGRSQLDSLHSWAEIYSFFSSFYTEQLKGRNRFFRFLIDLDPALLQKALNAATVMGRYDITLDILSLRQKAGMSLSSEGKKIYESASLCKAAANAMYHRRDTEELSGILANAADPIFKESLTYAIADAYSKMFFSRTAADFSTVKAAIDDSLARFGEIGELYALQGDCLLKMGESESSGEAYRKAAGCISNAIALQWLMDGGHLL